MKVRWREHEAVLVMILGAILLGGHLWRIFLLSQGDLQTLAAQPFVNSHVPFNLYRNLVLPDIALGLLVFLCYCFLNYIAFPRFFRLKQVDSKLPQSVAGILSETMITKKGKRYILLLIELFLLTIVLLAGITLATYFNDEWRYSYPGFSFIPKNGYNPGEQINIYGVYIKLIFLTLLYILYVFVKEMIIRVIEVPDGKNIYRALISNKLTAFLVIYIAVPFFASVFHLLHNSEWIGFWYSLTLPVFVLVMINIYWLFPRKGEHPFLSVYFLSRLIAVVIACNILALVSPLHPVSGAAYFAFLLFQFLIVTPLSWLYYQQQKDKIQQLRGAEKALVQSKASLQSLRSQINPHFLFNTLNTLYGTALQEDASRTAEGIQRLGEMMRFMLDENTQDFIDMEKEISYIKNYLVLQKLRIVASPDILIEDHINNNNCNHRIAPMLLIPFIENAFKHGIDLDKRSWIRISLDCTATEIHFMVANSNHKSREDDPEKEKGGIGNNNVLERLKLIYPGKHSIAITNSGTEFKVQLTILTEKN